ncbi:RNAse P Rpr2/Rpp21/SNM1 subunit domain containing protein [Plasmodiophora brassicae]
MTDANETATRIEHLWTLGHAVAARHPGLARAYLSAVRDASLAAAGIGGTPVMSASMRSRSCFRCASCLVPSRNCSVRLVPAARRRRSRSARPNAIEYRCGTCQFANRLPGSSRQQVRDLRVAARSDTDRRRRRKQLLKQQGQTSSVNPVATRPASQSLFFKFQCQDTTTAARNRAIVVGDDQDTAADAADAEPTSDRPDDDGSDHGGPPPTASLYNALQRYRG